MTVFLSKALSIAPNHYELYFRLAQTAPKAVFAILTREAFRKFWIGEEANTKVYTNIKTALLTREKVKAILGDDIKVVKRDTQAMWDPIERPEVKLMVISIESGTFVKNAGEFSEKLGNADVNTRLLLFQGLEYQCNNASYELLYYPGNNLINNLKIKMIYVNKRVQGINIGCQQISRSIFHTLLPSARLRCAYNHED